MLSSLGCDVNSVENEKSSPGSFVLDRIHAEFSTGYVYVPTC